MLECNSTERLLQLATVVLTDPIPYPPYFDPIPPAYLFSETKDNERSVFQAGKNLLRKGVVERLLVVRDEKADDSGYPGAANWISGLKELGIDSWFIDTICCKESLNTYTESLALVRFATAKHWKCLVVIAPPFHQLRAFVSVVSAVRKIDAKIRVFNQVGDWLPWNKTVFHSQGILRRTRLELIAEEMRLIKRYTRKGDLLSADEVLKYLAWRNKR